MEKYFDNNQVNEILEAAYLAGFEKSRDNLSIKDEFKQALNFLTIKILQYYGKGKIYFSWRRW